MENQEIQWDCDVCHINFPISQLREGGKFNLVCVNCLEKGFHCQDCGIFTKEILDPIQIVYCRCLQCQAKFRLRKI